MLMITFTIMARFMSQKINGNWPAFDIGPFPDRQRELKTWISEDAGPAASIDAPMAVAAYSKLDRQGAIRILAGVERTISTWRMRGRELGMSAGDTLRVGNKYPASIASIATKQNLLSVLLTVL
jgi:hypothetical protein